MIELTIDGFTGELKSIEPDSETIIETFWDNPKKEYTSYEITLRKENKSVSICLTTSELSDLLTNYKGD